MFDFAWSEIALIGIVALVAIGPKDLPVAIKAVAQMVKKARKMAGEFQTHVDEMVREANLNEVRDSFNDIRRMDIKGKILSAVDDDGSIRKTLSEPVTNFAPPPPPVPVHDAAPPAVHGAADAVSASVTSEPAVTSLPELQVAERPVAVEPAPAFVPPRYAPAQAPHAAPVPPAFIPPAFIPSALVPASASPPPL